FEALFQYARERFGNGWQCGLDAFLGHGGDGGIGDTAGDHPGEGRGRVGVHVQGDPVQRGILGNFEADRRDLAVFNPDAGASLDALHIESEVLLQGIDDGAFDSADVFDDINRGGKLHQWITYQLTGPVPGN